MSAILDALRKLQRDREDDSEAPDLRTAVARSQPARPAEPVRARPARGSVLSAGRIGSALAIVGVSAAVGFYLRNLAVDAPDPPVVATAPQPPPRQIAAAPPRPSAPAPREAPPAAVDGFDTYPGDLATLEGFDADDEAYGDFEDADDVRNELEETRQAAEQRRRSARRAPPRRNPLRERAQEAKTPPPLGAQFGRPSAQALGSAGTSSRSSTSPARVSATAPRPAAPSEPKQPMTPAPQAKRAQPRIERPPEINFEPPETRSALAGPGVPVEPPAPEPEPAPDPSDFALLEGADGLDFPALQVDSILWHPSPDRREALVLIEGGRSASLREGDIVAGVAVFRINPGSVEFRVGRASKTIPIGR